MYHKPGIYFGMSDAEYHADPSLSTSAIKKLIQDPEEYWDQSFMNPNPPPREQKDCLARGTLWHCRILEPELFNKKYVLAPFVDSDAAEGRKILRTMADMKDWLEENGVVYKKSANKDELEKSVWEAYRLGLGNPEPYLFDRENIEFANKNQDRTVIWSREIYRDMLAAERAFEEHPYFSQVFKGGHSEVSIFWVDDSGLPMKGRIDKLKPNAILDYKTLHVQRGKSTRQAALNAIKFENYDIQVAVYTLGLANVINLINAGNAEISGDVSGEFIDALCVSPEKPFGFVFQKEDRPYTIRGLKVVRRSGDLFNVFGNGLVLMNRGIETFLEYKERFGNKRWFSMDGLIEVADHEIYYS
jgi:hypothetical protein